MSDDRAVAVYRSAVAREFAFLKGTRSLDDLHARGVTLPDARGLLVPVCELHADDDRLLELLARWRDENAFAFPTRFPVTLEGTARWLRAAVLDVEDRLLFLVLDRHGHPVGHLGFANALNDERTLEIDNVVRGEKHVEPGLMSLALERLVDWAEELFLPETIFLRVLADNEHAIRYYRRLGFVETGREPLCEVVAGDQVSLVPAEDGETADAWFLRLERVEGPVDETETILTAGPSISARETSYALDAVRTGWNDRWNGYLDRFEHAFAEYVGAAHAIPMSSCTGALHLSLLALGIGPGDEVIVPEITWVATANAVSYTGATPVFADVEEESWCLDPRSVEARLTERTVAIMPVHLYGHPSRLDELSRIASARGLALVEDAAPAIGAEVNGRRVGAWGAAGGFSFQGAKLLVSGEGGMLVTNDDEVHRRARKLWNHGHEGDFWIGEQGWKYKLSNVQAAVGLGQLERVDELVEAKRRIYRWYEEELAGVEGVTLSPEAPWARSIHWMTSIRVAPESGLTRDDMRRALAARKIDTRPVFPAISRYPIWERVAEEAGPVASRIAAEGINLPSGVRLRRDQVARVGRAVRDAMAGAARRAA